MDSVLEQSKKFEHLVIKHDPAYNVIVDAIDIIKKFIIDNDLIIYGGSAIDYALRLHGDKIYPDEALAIPDLDFYSPNNVEHSYQIADLLYKAGWDSARSINALHTETQRVDVMDNHFVADITYVPPDVFAKLPFIVYNGMRIIHPDFQRLDIHSSLSFPYDDPPREVIFARWSKDIKRFNMLAKYYPVVAGEGLPVRACTIPSKYRQYVFNGFIAYAILYTDYIASGGKPAKGIIPARFSDDGRKITFDTIDQIADIVSFKPQKHAGEISPYTTYEPYGNILPETVKCEDGVTISSTRNRLLSSNSVVVHDIVYRIANIQYILKHFLAMSYVEKFKDRIKHANTYLNYYNSLMEMIASIPIETSPLYPSITTYGSENISISKEIALNKMHIVLDNAPAIKTPVNYYPAKNIPKGLPHPEFNPDDTVFFRKSGRTITELSTVQALSR